MRIAKTVLIVTLATTFLSLLLMSPIATADDWVKSHNNGQPVWVDTSHWETRNRWVDTSHWETRWGWQWISAGYWHWESTGHDDFYYCYMENWPPFYGLRGYYIGWWQEAWYCCWDWGWYPMRFAYSWGYHEHRSEILCPGAGWSASWYQWHDKSYWAWIDTSHWEWGAYAAWVSSGYWQSYSAWVQSGYWQDPLHGTVAIRKEPAYVFTRWHWLTYDSLQHSSDDEKAHLDVTIEWQTDRPVSSIYEYVDVQRTDQASSTDRVTVTTTRIATPVDRGTLTTRVEYDHAGLGAHYFILTATDGSSATVYCDIPINGFRSLNVDSAGALLTRPGFSRSIQDSGSVVF